MSRSVPDSAKPEGADIAWMRMALREARRGYGRTSPNPMVGALIVASGQLLGKGWHHGAGQPHAEIEALADARRAGRKVAGATLYVTLEPCCTHGRTPPCVDAIAAAGLRRVVVAATDPNPCHQGRGFALLRAAGIEVQHGLLAGEAEILNRAFNRWIQTHLPYVTLKAAMTLDGKMATASGESKWITGEAARRRVMTMRRGVDAILVGVRTVLADDPSLTVRAGAASGVRREASHQPLRIVLDSRARTPLSARLVNDPWADHTVIVTTDEAPRQRVAELAGRVRVIASPKSGGRVDLAWLMRLLGGEGVTSLLVEGGGEVHAGFLDSGLAQEVAFFYSPKVLGGQQALRAVGGAGAEGAAGALLLEGVRWRRIGLDLFLSARLQGPTAGQRW